MGQTYLAAETRQTAMHFEHLPTMAAQQIRKIRMPVKGHPFLPYYRRWAGLLNPRPSVCCRDQQLSDLCQIKRASIAIQHGPPQ